MSKHGHQVAAFFLRTLTWTRLPKDPLDRCAGAFKDPGPEFIKAF
jgi:hypothetical protein